ncbi:MAG: ABC transporter ATP-binding protein [Planctomycetota bacterium]|jgi:phospholipid/cholesterol/gamma-HCH transport system ATP-binding protein
MSNKQPHIVAENVTLAYGTNIIQRGLNFTVKRGDVFIIMGGSGCGKSTVMRGLVGLLRPTEGEIYYEEQPFWNVPPREHERMKRRFGVMYQKGALWSSMTSAENVALPLEEYTDLSDRQIRKIASFKLALVGLAGFEDYYPYEISGGMQKRLAVARAMSLDPEILFFDEPSAGLDPLSSRRLDELIMELNQKLGTTMVIVTHELTSIFEVGNNSVFLDAATRTQITTGDPKVLRDQAEDPRVREFLTRGKL